MKARFALSDPAGDLGGDGASGPSEAAAALFEHRGHEEAERGRAGLHDGVTELAPPSTYSILEGGESVAVYASRLLAGIAAGAPRNSAKTALGNMTAGVPRFTHAVSHLITALNANMMKRESSGALTDAERDALAMLHRLIYGESDEFYARLARDPMRSLGISTAGASTANLVALWCARNATFDPRPGFVSVARDGICGAIAAHGLRGAVVLGSDQAHYSFDKATDLLGLGRSAFVRVPSDARGRAVPSELDRCAFRARDEGKAIIALVGVAGTTDAGAIDPLDELADVARAHGAFFHVDAAWGGPLLFSRRHAALLRGIERADSVTIDGHKQLYLPVGYGALVLRSEDAASVIEHRAPYALHTGSGDLGARSLDGSRPATALHLHAALHVIGRRGYEALIEATLERARSMAQAIQRRSDFELLLEPELGVVLYRFRPNGMPPGPPLDALNIQIREEQLLRGRGFVSRTTWRHADGGPCVALRAVLCNPLTQPTDVLDVLNEQADIGHGLVAELARVRRT